MRTKLFALASVTALAGLLGAAAVPGCSSDTTTSNPTDTDGGGPEVKPTPPREAAVEEVPEAGPVVCPTTTPIAAGDLTKWEPPAAVDSPCTQPNLDDLKAAFKASPTGSVKFTEIKTALGTACAACVFSPVTLDGGANPHWSVFPETMPGSAYDNRTASCFARLKDEACGRGRSQFEFCLNAACKKPDCATDALLKTCKQKVQSGACKAITTAYVAACPMETELLAACNIYSSIALSCGGGADAGLDAAPP